MRPLLQHLIDITAHRDQDRLERSVASTLVHLVGALRIRKLETMWVENELFLRPVELTDGRDRPAEDRPPEPAVPESLKDYPELLACIEQVDARAERRCDDGRHMLWLPVRVDGKVRSCLEITSAGHYDDATRAIILGIFEVYCNYQSLLDYSERDALTGLLNRRTFDDQFPRYQEARDVPAPPPPPSDALAELSAAAAQEDGRLQLFTLDEDTCRPLSEFGVETAPFPPTDAPAQAQAQWLAVVDIDHFKRVNDRFGHVYGDEVLILVSNILKASFRGDDRIFRFGGEEFVVLLRPVTLSVAHTIFERFRRNVEQHVFPQVGQVTISLGFAKADAGAPIEILGRADQALYYAKEHGRNQVRHFEELERIGALRSGGQHEDIEMF